MTRPLLNPPCPGWQEDLSHPDIPPIVPPSLGIATPNYINEIYLELSRSHLIARGLLMSMTVFVLVVVTCFQLLLFSEIKSTSIFSHLMDFFAFSFLILMVVFGLRIDIAPPRDLPIRFNRARQRIYAYNFKCRWWNPFGRWRVVPVAYNWSQVRAERWKQRGTTAQGALIIKWGVVLSIVEPGTNKVIDRFPLSTMGADEFAWAYICTYMQQGPSALPPTGPPRDHNDVPWYNLALRLAPKVKWPAEMDRESRTAP